LTQARCSPPWFETTRITPMQRALNSTFARDVSSCGQSIQCLTELWLLLRREIGVGRSDAAVSGLLGRGLRREPLEDLDYRGAWQFGGDWSDQNFSLTDRQAFVVLERTRRFRAWSYDYDFSIIRLGPARDRPLDLVR